MNYDNDIFIPKIWHVLYIYRLLYQFNDKIHYYIANFPEKHCLSFQSLCHLQGMQCNLMFAMDMPIYVLFVKCLHILKGM